MSLPEDLVMPLLGIDIPKETQNTISQEYMQPYVHRSIIYNHHDMGATQIPIESNGGKGGTTVTEQ